MNTLAAMITQIMFQVNQDYNMPEKQSVPSVHRTMSQ